MIRAHRRRRNRKGQEVAEGPTRADDKIIAHKIIRKRAVQNVILVLSNNRTGVVQSLHAIRKPSPSPRFARPREVANPAYFAAPPPLAMSRKMPRRNGCNLFQTALNRAPYFFGAFAFSPESFDSSSPDHAFVRSLCWARILATSLMLMGDALCSHSRRM